MDSHPTRVLTFWMKLALGAAALALAIAGVWFYQSVGATIRRQAERNFAAIAEFKVLQIVEWRRDRLDEGAFVAGHADLAIDIARYLEDPAPRNAEAIRDRFRQVVARGEFDDALLVDLGGRMRLALDRRAEPGAGVETALAKALATRRPAFTELGADARYRRPHLSVVAPVFTDSVTGAAPLAAVVLVCDAARHLYPLVQAWPLPSDTAETVVVRRDGDGVLFLNDLRFRRGAALSFRLPLTRSRAPSVRGVTGFSGIAEGPDYRGVEVLSFVQPVPGSTWVVVAKEDTAEVLSGWRAREATFYALLLALLAGVGAVGLVAWQRDHKAYYRALYGSEVALRTTMERHSVTLNSIGDAVIATDARGRLELLNPVAEALTGWTQAEAAGRPLEDVFCVVNEQTGQTVESPVGKVLREGLVVGLANHTLLVARDGSRHPIADSAAPIRDESGRTTGVVLVFRDQTVEWRVRDLMAVRVDLLDHAVAHASADVLARALEHAGRLLNSSTGVLEVIGPDGATPVLTQWFPRTPSSPVTAERLGRLAGAGHLAAWREALEAKRPFVSNEPAESPGFRPTVPGHPFVRRWILVPVTREGRTVAAMALANKPSPYTEQDVETASYIADVTWQIIETKLAEEKKREVDLRFRAIYDHVDVGIVECSLDMRISLANPAYCRRLGYAEHELIGMHLRDITHPESVVENLRLQDRLVSGDIDSYSIEKRFLCKDGSSFYGFVTATLIRDAAGRPDHTIGTVVDITERKRSDRERDHLQAQLIMASKMESIGRLAGGIAHDFNNMLLVILGSVERELARTEPCAPCRDALVEIQGAALRSSSLTRQLVAFARTQVIAPKVLDLDQAVEGTLTMIRRLIGEDIDLVWRPRSGDWRIKVDPAQLDQVLTNLCVNARDAIEGAGKVVIETDRVTLDRAYCDVHPGCIPGEYVLLAISDDGRGMDRATVKRVFEPFFTTKPVGHGAGLGLATVYGIVKQSDGFINVYSEPGHGSTFKVYLPRCAGEAAEVVPEPVRQTPRGEGQTILLVEDEASILRLVSAMLGDLGYTVLPASTAAEAVEWCERRGDQIRLLVTDVVMADINGRDLAARLSAMVPDLPCLFMSGYTAAVIARRGVLEPGVDFLQKPFSMDDLAAKVSSVLLKGGTNGRS